MAKTLTPTLAMMLDDGAFVENPDTYVEFSVDVTINGTTTSIPVVTVNQWYLAMEQHHNWRWMWRYSGEDIPEVGDGWIFTDFAVRWEEFINRKTKAVSDWIIDIYTKIDPIMTGWERVHSSETYDQYGYTDSVNKYVAGNSRNGKYADITISNRVPTVGTVTADKLERTVTESTGTNATTRLGSASSSVSINNGTVTVTAADPSNNPTTKVWTGTFDSSTTAGGSIDMPLTNQQESTGDTSSITGSGRVAGDETKGSVFNDGAEISDLSRTYDGEKTVQTDKEALSGDVIQQMLKYVKYDITKRLLDEFLNETTFYCEGVDWVWQE